MDRGSTNDAYSQLHQCRNTRLHRCVHAMSCDLLRSYQRLPYANPACRSRTRRASTDVRRYVQHQRERDGTQRLCPRDHLPRLRTGVPTVCRGLRESSRRRSNAALRGDVPPLRRMLRDHCSSVALLLNTRITDSGSGHPHASRPVRDSPALPPVPGAQHGHRERRTEVYRSKLKRLAGLSHITVETPFCDHAEVKA